MKGKQASRRLMPEKVRDVEAVSKRFKSQKSFQIPVQTGSVKGCAEAECARVPWEKGEPVLPREKDAS